MLGTSGCPTREEKIFQQTKPSERNGTKPNQFPILKGPPASEEQSIILFQKRDNDATGQKSGRRRSAT